MGRRGDEMLADLDLDDAVAAGGLYEFPDRAAGPCLDPAADGQGGEHDRRVGLDGLALAMLDGPDLQVRCRDTK